MIRDDLLQGLTILVIGGVLFAVHRWGRSQVEQAGDSANLFMQRAYLTIQLAIFSLAGLISLIIGISETLRYFIVETNEFGARVAPAGSLATALVFVPIWAYYLAAMLRQSKKAEGR